jgi:hypothetical protein
LDVRTKVAKDLHWKPVLDLIREVHEGDPSLTRGWPFGWWGLEPFCEDHPDWRIRYASVFRVGEDRLWIPQVSLAEDLKLRRYLATGERTAEITTRTYLTIDHGK